jgi:glycosyltransferase involved in cell wall biosynthesis
MSLLSEDVRSTRVGRTAGPPIIASVPSNHVYVRHLAPMTGTGPVRLPDPDPESPSRSAVEKWWPPVMLRPEWAATADFDVFHLQFGFDAVSPDELAEFARVLRERGKPFVYTVHDLRNPHHETRALHDEQLDVLAPAADSLITLTPSAAAEIQRRWGRTARVLPHPHVVDFRTMAVSQDCRAKRAVSSFRVGIHLKSLRASMAPMRVLPSLVETVRELPGAVLQVNAHHDVVDDDGARRDAHLASYLRDRADSGDLELRVHDFLPDAQLWNYLGSLDVSVLPYRFGTHSGWLEACRDLGTTVVAPTCGYFAEQGPVLSYTHDEDDFDPASLRDALVMAYERRPRHAATIEERARQRAEVAEAHDALYRALTT